ncbi:MAG: 5-formyltetrahydrofolate cyclo-ligase [Clostridia bacterium]|nr:5-formyltetrahydrofolate cyclo-ligase [Clostridia bacterium]
MNGKEQKQTLRRRLLEKRRRLLFGEDGEALQQALRQQLLQSDLWQQAEIVLLTASTPEEPDTIPLCRAALDAGKQLYLPRCEKGGKMEFFALTALEALAEGAFGIREPPPTRPLTAEEAAKALCLVPAIACDRYGHRLGYGGGYYDRWLACHSPLQLCLLPSAMVEEQLPHEPHDIPIPLLLTEQGLSATACPGEGP